MWLKLFLQQSAPQHRRTVMDRPTIRWGQNSTKPDNIPLHSNWEYNTTGRIPKVREDRPLITLSELQAANTAEQLLQPE